MKKRLLVYILLTVFAFNLNAKDKKITSRTINLTNQVFLSKIFNYEKNSNAWVYLNDKPCLIDFYASWCGPCKSLAPIMEELAAEYAGEVYVYKVNIDKEKELAAAFGISSIPVLLFCPMGENPQSMMGAYPKEDLKKIIDEFLLKKEKTTK